MGALFCDHLREDAAQARLIADCLGRHGLPRTPADLGMSNADFAKAVGFAPSTRPGRYTILERLGLPEAEVARRVEDYGRSVTG